MDSPAAAAPVTETKKKGDKVRSASTVEEEESPSKKQKTPEDQLKTFLATYPKDKQMVLFLKTQSNREDSEVYIFSVEGLEEEFKTTLEKFQQLPQADLYELIIKDRDSDEFEDDEDDKKWNWYEQFMEEARIDDADYSAGQYYGQILVATREVPDLNE